MTFKRDEEIINYIKKNAGSSSKEIYDGIKTLISYATVKRVLTKLVNENLLITTGNGKGTKYLISPAFELLQPIDIEKYFKKETDKRKTKKNFNFNTDFH